MIAFGILLGFCALSQSLPIGNPSDSVLIDYKADSHSRFEEGTPGKSVKGSYSWINEDKVYQVDYTADEKGYRPRLTVKSVSEAEQKPIAQQESVQVSENKEEKPVKESIADAIIYEIPSLIQHDTFQVPALPNEEKKKVTPEKEVGTDAIVLEIPVLDVAQQDSVQVPALLNAPMTEAGDAFIFEIPLFDVAQQQDGFQNPTLENEEEKVTPGIEGGFDAIILDIPDFDEPTPIVQKGSQASLTSQDDKIVAEEIVAPPSKPVTLQADSQSDSNKVADKVAVKVPDASVQEQDVVQIVPPKVTEEVKPDQFVVVVAPAQSGLAGQQFNSQIQSFSQGEPSESEQEKVGDNEGVVILQLPSNSDVDGQEEGYSQDDTTNPEIDTSDLYNIAPLFNFQPQGPTDDEIYTDDAIIIDAAGDPFASDGAQADEDQDWGQAESQDQASEYLNAMLQEYLNQFYSNPKQKVDSKENHRSKFEDDLIKSYNDYKQEKISRKEDDFSATSDYQRMLAALSSGEQQVVSYDDYQNFLRHLQIEEEDRPRSKVSDVITQDQGESNEELEGAFRVLMDLPENDGEQLITHKKENSKFESGDQLYAIDETFLRELYYQLWLDAQQQPAQPEPMYYAIYPESAYYYR